MIKNRTLFNRLSEGGKVEMPIADGPFGFYFGMFADKLVLNGWWTLTQKITGKSNRRKQRTPNMGFGYMAA